MPLNKEFSPLTYTENDNISSIQQPSIPIIDLGFSLILKWINTEIYSKQLIQALENNIIKDLVNKESSYEFYTDRSLKNRGSNQVLMGSSWIQTKGLNPNTTF